MTRPRSTAAELRDGILLCGGALICYLLLLQDAFVNEDARVFVNNLGLGKPLSDLHPWYGPIGGTFTALLTALDVSVFRSLELLSALGTTVGVFFFHRSLLLLQPDRVRRNLTTALCALTPAVVFFATVVEIPGVFLGFVGVSWWLAARCLGRPSWGRAAALGASTAAATLVHGTGHLLPGVMVAFLWTWSSKVPLPRVRVAALVLAAHAVTFLGLEAVFVGEQGRGALDFFLSFVWSPPSFFVRVAGLEWLLPFFPISVLALGCLGLERGRLPALAFNGLALLYVFVSYVIIPGMWERGTYALPLVYFGAALVGSHVSVRTLTWSLALAMATAVFLVKEHDREPAGSLPPEAILELAEEQMGIFVVRDELESDAVLRVAPHIPVTRAFQLVQLTWPSGQVIEQFDRVVASSAAIGHAVCLSQGALDMWAEYFADLHRHILETYELRKVGSGEFTAYRLMRRE